MNDGNGAAPPPLRLAVYGVVAEGAGSGAGMFAELLAALLARGHRVDHYGPRPFEQKSLGRFANYRFVALTMPRLERLWWRAAALRSPYPLSLVSQISQIGWQREAVLHMNATGAAYDIVFCPDAVALWPSRWPLISWPQSPPQTEAAALRSPEVMRRVVEQAGAPHFAALQLFYAYRWLVVRAALRFSDLYLCGSSWAEEGWVRFGAPRARLRRMPYFIDLGTFADVPPLGERARPFTFLWLGRAVPRKRLDLFIAGVRELRRRHPEVRARLVGNFRDDPFAAKILESIQRDPTFSIENAVDRSAVPALFGAIDVLVQPSENENFGFSVAEALAAGRPVVLGPTNGTADYVGRAGFVFTSYESVSLAGAMERAMNAVEAEGPAVSAEARRSAHEHFAPSSVVARFEAVCREVMARRRSVP